MATQQTRDYLWKHSFRGGTRSEYLEPYGEMAERFQGLGNQFNDAEVQPAFAPVTAAMASFADLAGNHLHFDERHPEVLTAQTDEDRRNRMRSQDTSDAIKQVENSARELYVLMENFLLLAREKLGF